MSNYIPFEIQTKIVKSLPLKSLIRFQTVSKQWKSLIHSSEFIHDHQKIHKTKSQHHLLVQYGFDTAIKPISIVDDNTFPHQKSSLTVPQTLSMHTPICLLSSDNGVLCFSYEDYRDTIMMAVLWNPTVKKSVGIVLPNVLHTHGMTHIGFGVCPNTSDIKLVKINCIRGHETIIDWEVQVFTLSTRVWKSVSNIPLAFKTCTVTYSNVSIGGFIYWLALDDRELCYMNFVNSIVSFDLKNDEFGEVCLPDSLVDSDRLGILKFKESLGLLECYYNDSGIPFCNVWILKEGVTKSFTKMFSMKMGPDTSNPYKFYDTHNILELRKNGEAVIETEIDSCRYVLEVYEPCSGHYNSIGIGGTSDSLSVMSYVETLLLLNESNSVIHDNDGKV